MDMLKQMPQLLLQREIEDFDELTDKINNATYFSLDKEVPVARFRGTSIRKINGGQKYELIGWERNISRIQKMDLSLPAIIRAELDCDFTVTRIKLDENFAGSKGVLCYHKYLNENLQKKMIGKKLHYTSLETVNIDCLFCFHLVEILSAVVSSLQLMEEKNLDYIFEEEVMDGVRDGFNLYFRGKQKFSFSDKEVDYSMFLENALNHIKFNENGNILTKDSIDVTGFKDGEEIVTGKVNNTSEIKIYVQFKKISAKLLKAVKKDYTDEKKNAFMCSNLSPEGFIGAMIQSLSMKMFSNNYPYILHCLTGIQRCYNQPKCIGSVDSYEEAEKYFPSYNIADALSIK